MHKFNMYRCKQTVITFYLQIYRMSNKVLRHFPAICNN